MGKLAIVALVVLWMSWGTSVSAQDAGPPARGLSSPWCTEHVDPERADQGRVILDKIVTLLASTTPASKKDFAFTRATMEDIRQSIIEVRCTETVLAPKQRAAAQAFEARATKVIADLETAIAAEEKAREAVVLPMCEATFAVEDARAGIAHERANPSGVVNLARLHEYGETIQYYQPQIDALRPQYVALRHHGFGGWNSEAACVAESEKGN